MKKITFSFGLLFILFSSASYSQELDPTFYDFGWVKMMKSGNDYATIVEKAELHFGDTTNRTKENHYKQYRRWAHFWQSRLTTDDNDRQNGKSQQFHGFAKAINQAHNQNVCLNNHSASDWESWGLDTHPAQNGGSLHYLGGMGVMWCAKIDTSDQTLQTIYAGSPIGGLWKTTDGGTKWQGGTTDTLLATTKLL